MSDLALKSSYETLQPARPLSSCGKELEQFKMPETPDGYFNFFTTERKK